MSQKKRPTLVLMISPLSRLLEIPSWTFFNSPFRVESKNVHIFIIWWYLDRDIAKILGCSHFDIQYFLFITESSKWSLRSDHEHPLALMSTHEQLWIWGDGTISDHKWSWHHYSMFMKAPACLWMILVPRKPAPECSWAVMSTNECSKAPMSAHERQWALNSAH